MSGILTGNPALSIPSAIDLTDITGSGQGYTFTGVVPVGADPGITYDNLVYTASNAIHVDGEGDLLDLSSSIGTSLAHVYYDSTGYHVDVYDPNDPVDSTPFNIDINTFKLARRTETSPIPEPSTWMLLGTGLIGLATLTKRELSHR